MDYPVPTSTRSSAVDLLRGTALLAMMVAHAARVVPAHAGQEAQYHLISQAEPGISGAFLFLVGRSLAVSRWQAHCTGPGPLPWYLRCLKRSGVLYGLGVGLFVLQFGVRFPDVLLSPDILSAIAWAVIVVATCLAWTPKILPWAFLMTLVATVLVERAELSLPGVNAGPGGAIPLLAFAILGAWYAQVRHASWARSSTLVAREHRSDNQRQGHEKRPHLLRGGVFPRIPSTSVTRIGTLVADVSQPTAKLFVALGLALCLLGVLLSGPLTWEHASLHRVGAVEHRIWFWNHSVRGSLIVAGLLCVISSLLDAQEHRLKGAPVGLLRLVGRHALAGYVVHLSVLGILERLNLHLSGALALSVVVVALIGVVSVVALVLELRVFGPLRARVRYALGVAL